MTTAKAATTLGAALAIAATALLPLPSTAVGQQRPTAGSPPVPSRSMPQAAPPGGAIQRTATAAPFDPSLRRASTQQPEATPAAPEVNPAPGGSGYGGAAAAPEGEKPLITLPPEPIDPFLVTKDQGPFMILACTFRSPYAAKYAQALAMELRQGHNLPAYIFYARVHPGGSNIRNIPPTADAHVRIGQNAAPEAFRSYDEAMVLVGNFPSIDDAETMLKQVKRIKPGVIEELAALWAQADSRVKRHGLSGARITLNPLVAAQRLYPGTKEVVMKPGGVFDPLAAIDALVKSPRPDPFVKRLNQGPRSLFNNPGDYTLVVAEYGGRVSFNPSDPRLKSEKALAQSPLLTAHDDAERLAEALAKSETLQAAGHKVYVYHDRSSSRVCVGSFSSETDANASALFRLIVQQVEMFKTKDGSVQPVKNGAVKSDPSKFREKLGELMYLTPSATLLRVPKG